MKNKLEFRKATLKDLPDLAKMLADDELGAIREDVGEVLSERYIGAFEAINTNSTHELMIVEMEGYIVGTFQLSFLQYLTHQGGLRAQIEGVRIHSNCRRQGIGKRIFEYAIGRAKEKNCIMLQLTTDKQRPHAITFYQSIGFIATHEGMKLNLQ
ncbi:GNAT family N-acetyltransferase [Pedobacter deserti]|uniref:GNAT family N-acetyltransferase n=1 Tax=Pedobacter deserti TaxID=2817382 RepID=UPI00210B4830|nr:GNAT family N-acetyltransferase [Pedobacter sp. SYSU D00382]